MLPSEAVPGGSQGLLGPRTPPSRYQYRVRACSTRCRLRRRGPGRRGLVLPARDMLQFFCGVRAHPLLIAIIDSYY